MKKITSSIAFIFLFASIICNSAFAAFGGGPFGTDSFGGGPFNDTFGGGAFASTFGEGLTTLQQMQAVGNLTFYKNYATSQASGAADYSAGSPTLTVTAARSGSAPATYYDAGGVLQTMTTANVPRWTQGYYDTTGFHSRPGLFVENTVTNRALWSSAFENVVWTKTNITAVDGGSLTGSPTTTVTTLTATSTDGTLTQAFTDAAAGVYTADIFVKRKTGTGTISLRANTADGYTDITTSVSALMWTRVQVQSSSATNPTFDLKISTSGDELYVVAADLAKLPYMTTHIPITTTARARAAEQVAYTIASNRTAGAESIFIKFTPTGGSFANDNIQRTLTSTDTKNRDMRKLNTNSASRQYANITDNVNVLAFGTTAAAAGTSYVFAGAISHTPPQPYVSFSMQGTREGVYTAADFTDPAWGTNFYVGSSTTNTLQANGIFEAIAIYAGFKDVPDVNKVSSIMSTAVAAKQYSLLPDTYTSSNVVSGSTTGTTLDMALYEFHGRLIRTGADTILMFNRVGSDVDAALPGQFTLRTYTISTASWGAESTIYDPGLTYTTSEMFVRIVGSQLYMYIVKYVRATPGDGHSVIVLIKSTDLTGASWGSEITIRGDTNGRPNFGGWLTTSNPSLNYLVFVGDTGNNCFLYQTTDNGETFSVGPTITTGTTVWGEGEFTNISGGRIIGLLRDNAGNYMYQVNSSDYGATWTSPFNTFLGSAAGVKVTPKLIHAAGHPERLVTYFYDRGDSRSKISGPTAEDDAFNNVWLTPYLLGTASQGNGDICISNATTLQYLIYTTKETGDVPKQTDVLWWVWKDIYNYVQLTAGGPFGSGDMGTGPFGTGAFGTGGFA